MSKTKMAAKRKPAPTPATITRNTPVSELPEFLTVLEFAAYFRLGRGLAYQLASERGVRLGRVLRVPKSAIADMVNDR